MGALLLVHLGAADAARGAVIRVPETYSGIQAAINAAQSGDTVLVSRGTYAGGLVISGKAITLASHYISTGDTSDVNQTTISGGSPILDIQASAGATTAVRGLTFLNGSYQIVNRAPFAYILNNRFIAGSGDQVSFEGAGGLVRDCFFVNASDDGIDSDNASNPAIVNNTILGSGNDGIEIRLQSYTGPLMDIVILDNFISGCTEDGIQLIDYAGPSSRRFRIEGNVLADNGRAGLGCMADGNSTENYAGAPLVEEVRVIGNTFVGHSHGLTGGDNMLVMNNIFLNAAQIGVKRIGAASLVTHNDFWGNGTHHMNSNVDGGTSLFQDPMLEANYDLQPGSPCVDRGVTSIMWNGNTVSVTGYAGFAPDLGARETGSPPVDVDKSRLGGPVFWGVRPNPSLGGFTLDFTLPDTSPARIDVMDLAGRWMFRRDVAPVARGRQVLVIPEAGHLPAGVYVVRLSQGGRSVTTRAVVVK